MKSIFLTVCLFLLALTTFTACNSETKTAQTEAKQETAGITYTCPMHPEVKSNEPGKCPHCGMNLEKEGTATESHEGHDHDH